MGAAAAAAGTSTAGAAPAASPQNGTGNALETGTAAADRLGGGGGKEATGLRGRLPSRRRCYTSGT